jgi:hypothetical protein
MGPNEIPNEAASLSAPGRELTCDFYEAPRCASPVATDSPMGEIGVRVWCLGVCLLLYLDERLQNLVRRLVVCFECDLRQPPRCSCHEQLAATDMQSRLLADLVRHELCMFSDAACAWRDAGLG